MVQSHDAASDFRSQLAYRRVASEATYSCDECPSRHYIREFGLKLRHRAAHGIQGKVCVIKYCESSLAKGKDTEAELNVHMKTTHWVFFRSCYKSTVVWFLAVHLYIKLEPGSRVLRI